MEICEFVDSDNGVLIDVDKDTCIHLLKSGNRK